MNGFTSHVQKSCHAFLRQNLARFTRPNVVHFIVLKVMCAKGLTRIVQLFIRQCLELYNVSVACFKMLIRFGMYWVGLLTKPGVH